MKRTYQPSKRQRARKTGFRIRARKHPNILKSRRLKGRWRLAVKIKNKTKS